MLTREFDYELPRRFIAQRPCSRRDEAKLLVINRGTGGISHRRFMDLPELLAEGDLLVMNETKVDAARIRLRKGRSGGAADVLLLEETGPDEWRALLRPAARIRPGDSFCDPEDDSGRAVLEAVERLPGDGGWRLRVRDRAALDSLREAPLPPYIKRERKESARQDLERYQTVYARIPGSVAAPTAGLHFTEELLRRLSERGVELVKVVLHVGLGTFKPLREERVEDFRAPAERYAVSAEALAAIRRGRDAKRRIVAAGTTSVRVLETLAPRLDAMEGPQEGATDLFVYPGFDFKLTGAMVTNFHGPLTSPYVLVCAFAGTELIRSAYAEAMREEYRFLSFGDGQLIL